MLEGDADGGGLLENHWGTAEKTEAEEGADDVGARAEGEGAEGEDGERGVEEEEGAEEAEEEGPYLQSFFSSCLKVEPQRWVKEAEHPCTPPLHTTFLLNHDCLHRTLVEIHGQSLGYSLLS